MMESYPLPQKFGSYRIFAKVGQGGMAEVFLALSTKKEFENEFLAIKKLHAHLNENKPFVNLLIHEAKIGVLLNHPAIASVYDLGSHNSEFFLAMEYVHGKSLDRILEKIEEKNAPPLGLELSTYIVMESLRALAFAHQLKDVKGRDLNIIHRDVSPGNLLLEYKGNVKLADFGIATAESRLQVDLTSKALGKLRYMPPEQAVNDPVVQSSDLYSLALVYFELLTGRLPYESTTPSQLYRDVIDSNTLETSMKDSNIPPPLESIVRKCLHKSAKKRPASAGALFEDIRQFFLQNENTDFNSRTVRAYYRKKLAEYLRRHFESEIVLELEVIQKALSSELDDEILKETKPIDITDFANDPDSLEEHEKTQFLNDSTDEATRHYPLTEKERQSLIDGLPPKDALEPIAETWESAEEGFDLVTIPEYDLDWSRQPTALKDVNSKIKEVSLSRHEKEELEERRPSVEIQSKRDLENFEITALSGEDRTFMLPIESAVSSPEVDFEDTETTERARPLMEAVSEPDPMPQPKGHRSNQARSLLSFFGTNRRSLLWMGGLSLVFTVSILIALFAMAKLLNWSFFHETSKALLPTKQISLVILGDADLSSQKEWSRQLGENSQPLKELESFFNSEFQRYREEKAPLSTLVTFISHLPELVPQALADQLKKENFETSLTLLDQFGFKHKPAADGTVFIYLTQQSGPFPFHVPSSPRENQSSKPVGLIIQEIDKLIDIDFQIELGRQIAFIHGAQNKQDLETQLPRIPHGIAEPFKKPIFPQTRAELMGRSVLISAYQDRPAKTLREVVIGAETARELGWIKKESKLP